MDALQPIRSPESSRGNPLTVWSGFAVLLLIFWLAAQRLGVEQRLAGHFASTFLSFACIFAPLWGLGFGLADTLHPRLRNAWIRLLLPLSLLLPYLIFSLPRGIFLWPMAAGFAMVSVGLSALMEWANHLDGGQGLHLRWQDAIALAMLGLPVEFRWLARAWPIPGLAAFPKLLLLDAGLYAFLVIRRVPNVGFDLRLRARDLLIGAREWALFAPFAIGIGLAIGFIHFHPVLPSPGKAAAAVLVTFFFVAIPEEIFFRGLIQNLLSTRLSPRSALLVTAILFGLSHFNKGASFNRRYVFLATIAGIFYGRAWLDRHRVSCSALTHTGVDVVWSLWFR